MTNAIVLPMIALMALWPPWPFGRDRDHDGVETIRSLEDVAVEVDTSARIPGSEQKAIENYQLFLDLASDDPLLQAEAMRRIADLQLETAEAEQLQRNLQSLQSMTGGTIALYEQLLETFPDYSKNDLVLYQLARAYEASGNTEAALATLDRLISEYPGTLHYDEAHFRRGETLFVDQRYREAEDAYAMVLVRGPSSAYYDQSLYKMGWARFKQSRHEESLAPFFELLDREFRDDGSAALSGIELDPAIVYSSLGRAEQELIDDTLRVVSISFSYMDGAVSIREQFERIGVRSYAYVVYSNLGEFYLAQERYQDAADVFRAFVELEPYHSKAPFMQAEVIDAYKDGGFPDLVLEGKREFVEAYGPGSPYWSAFTYEQQPEVVGFLKSNLTDLAAYHHAAAQESKEPADYAEAARWYRTYLQSFPDDAKAAETNFLLAEVLFESRSFDEAAKEYEATAYTYPVHEKSAEAGYAALLAYKEHEATLDGEAEAAWHRRGIDSALRFSSTYSEHPEAAAVQTDAAEKLFELSEFEEARNVAAGVIAWETPVAAPLRRTAWTVIAHSDFDLGSYPEAESAYLELRRLLEPGDEQAAEIDERIASSIYKQGEQARELGLLNEAIDHFLRIGAAVPGSEIRATAEYDAAAALIQLEDWNRATGVLEQFRQSYPDHELAGDVTAKLAVSYVEAGDAASAAREFETIADSDAETSVRKEALWRAGELYDEAGEILPASNVYARYVDRYPDPVGEAIEARLKLADFAAELGDSRDRTRWLEEIVRSDAGAGSERTDRTRFLAATAQLELAEPYRAAFQGTRLVVPLQDSLAAKRARMEEALDAYGKAAEYGVSEVTTVATYEIAELYHQLSKDLFDSERPAELSATELAQYDILLEEQAFPFEEKAIELHEVNAARTAEGVYDKWVDKSMAALAELLPVRYAKQELSEYVVHEMY